MSTRNLCMAAWAGAQQMAVATGAVVMTAPAFIGYALEMADGDAVGARCLVPSGPPTFRERVLAKLGDIESEEISVADTERPRAAGERR